MTNTGAAMLEEHRLPCVQFEAFVAFIVHFKLHSSDLEKYLDLILSHI